MYSPKNNGRVRECFSPEKMKNLRKNSTFRGFSLKCYQCLFGGFTIIVILLFVFHQNHNLTYYFIYNNKNIFPNIPRVSKANNSTNPIKTVLLYNPKHWEIQILNKFTKGGLWENCPYSCQITTDIKSYDNSDAVIFVIDLLGGGELPVKKTHQVWIFAQYESTDYLTKEVGTQFVTQRSMKKYNQKVNWTISYRRDADLPFIHGSYSVKRNNDRGRKKDSNTKRGIAWFVSHCETSSRREIFVNLLKKTTAIDIYGHCGSLKAQNCPKSRTDAIRECWGLKESKCFDILDTKYMFYLSFENAMCRDYITEKGLHHVTQHDIIPIMRGSANYSIFSPPKSYIDTKDFSSVQQLSKYLTKVEKNKDMQEEFLHWKKHYESQYPIENWRSNMCNICQRLNNPTKYTRIYNDIYKWIVTPNNRDGCSVSRDL
ncbi:alpha-(1,3)-fucosyltransferase C-like [Saccostrea cucullata]|uniref:alpha-(1,3)-fucosyltransferase C-like n=1 Tax=Saccostrea cuccullata TaxID=36930 RepID=UPI002ED1F99B